MITEYDPAVWPANNVYMSDRERFLAVVQANQLCISLLHLPNVLDHF